MAVSFGEQDGSAARVWSTGKSVSNQQDHEELRARIANPRHSADEQCAGGERRFEPEAAAGGAETSDRQENGLRRR